VFSQDGFLDLGSRAAVDKALSRLAVKGTLRRLARGLYDYPRTHPQLGVLAPDPAAVARAIAGKFATRLQPSGAYAANLLGLSTQVPARIVYLTDGRAKTVRIGKQQIQLKHTTPKNMETAGRVSGLLIQALGYLGKSHVDQTMIAHLRRSLSSQNKKQLLKDIRYAPAWIADQIRVIGQDP
jgi:hypothetical protein